MLDEGATGYIKQALEESIQIPVDQHLMTPDGKFCIQLVGEDEIVLVPKEHPLMTMSNEEFAKTLDDPYWTIVAKVLYEKRVKV